MILVARYSLKNGGTFIGQNHGVELGEIIDVITAVDAAPLKTKVSEEKTMPGKRLYSPIALNNAFKSLFADRGWAPKRISMTTDIPEIGKSHKGFRAMDGVKNRLGVEVQLGKYAFMVYNVAAKMTIFHKRGIIDAGVEIVPMLDLAHEMSSGVSSFEQMKADLENRGEADIDIPVLVLGIDVKR